MKNLSSLLGCALGLLVAQNASAQYYSIFNQRPRQNPGALNTDSELRADQLPTGAGWNLLMTGDTATQRVPAWTPVQTLPFSFSLNGQAFTNYRVSSSGVLTFATAGSTAPTVPPTYNATGLPSPLVPDNSICLWGTVMAPLNDYLVTKTYGTAPHRQHWVQFNSVSIPVGRGSTPNSSSSLFASIVLEEGTNKVYLVWQRAAATAQTLTAGIQVNATTAFQVPTSPNVSIASLSDLSPADNQYYEFSPGTPPALDVSASYLILPRTAALQGNVNIQGVFTNLGSQTITNLTANYKVGNGPVVSAPLTGFNAATLDTAVFVHPTQWRPSAGGVIPIKAWLSAPNGGIDQQPANDTIRATVVVGDSTMQRKVVEEDFTSSTCGPCRLGNINVTAVNRLPGNRSKFVEIKYQQNFPAPGTDPYYTVESGARFNYYQGSYIPYMLLDGSWNQNSQSYTTSVLNQYRAVPGLVRVRGGYTLGRTNTTISATATIKPLLAVPAGRLVAHMVITERETQNNARTNGETRFYDVMKKMLPDQNGTLLPALASGQTYNLTQSFNTSLLPTAQSVEHFDSLRVVVFVQDVVTKEVYNGEYMTLLNPLANRSQQSGPVFALAPNPSSGQTSLFVNLTRAQAVRVEVLDAMGRRVLDRAQVALGSGAQEVPLNLEHKAAGLYTVRLTTNEGVRTQKLTLE